MQDLDLKDQTSGTDDGPLSPLSTAPDHLRQSLPPPSVSPPQQAQHQQSLLPIQHIRLACQACQRKKIKCDRTFPCGQCTRSALQCVASHRKPRTRHAGKKAIDSELRSRISKLESLVETLSGEVSLHQEHSDDHLQDMSTPSSGADSKSLPVNAFSDHASPTTLSDQAAVTSPTVRKYIGSAFWASLSDEVQALRDALEDEDEDEDAEFVADHLPPSTNVADDYDLLICPPGKIFVMPGAMSEPSPQVQAELQAMYLKAVSPIHHLFHVPSLVKLLSHRMPYLGYDPDSPPCRAVRTAIWFAAVNATSEEEVLARIGKTRAECIRQYRRFADLALYQANIMLTTDIPTLQALCIYLVASRINDSSRRVWTMAALAVRIAQALGLQTESSSYSPFEKETRRRLWHQVRFIDIMTAHDRGTEPMLYPELTDTPTPSNINDVEFDENSTEIVSRENCITDMSFSLVTYHATTFTARLNRSEYRPNGDTWKKRLDLAKEYETQAQEKFRQHCDLQIPYHRLVYSVIYCISTSMFLRAVRPMQRYLSSVPPRVDSPYVLGIATSCLRGTYAILQDEELQHWRWLVWVQWHALAVALAGLCSVRDTDLANETWFYAQDAFERIHKQVADARHGMLWRPIEKLHRKATAFRTGQPSHPTPPSRSASVPQATNDSSSISPTQTNSQQIPLAQDGLYAPCQNIPQRTTANWAFPFDTTVASESVAAGLYARSKSNPAYPAAAAISNPFPQQSPFDFSVPLGPTSTSSPLHNNNTTSPATGLTPLSVGDVSWLDWERVMQDFPEVDMGTEAALSSMYHPIGVDGLNMTNGEQFYGAMPSAQGAGFNMF